MALANRIFLMIVTLCSCIGWDQASKRMAAVLLKGRAPQPYFANTLRLEYAENAGAFLGLGSGLADSQRWALLIGAASVLLLGLTLFLCLKDDLGAVETGGYGLILAGGISNMLNRVVSGFVIDFLNIGIGTVRTGIFNVADLSIMVGFTTVAWCHWLGARPAASPAKGA